jgi:DNA helicase-2/ATP-dependent DNA helicase PcrA
MPQKKIIHLNDAQERAVNAPAGPLLIVAGAGTGKTSTLTSRILHLIDGGIQPSRICAITFTNKAATEMADRIFSYKQMGLPGTSGRSTPYIGTFHALGAKILRRECKLLGREPNFAIFDDHDSFDLIKKAVKGISLGKKQGDDERPLKPAKKDEAPAFFAQKISEIKNDAFMKGARRAQMSSEKESQVRTVFDAYEASLLRNNAFDFDDLIQKPVILFRKNPVVLKKYQSMFDAILVDEWQDINPMQYELVKLLAGSHRNLSVVGDDEQTIYTWRYADIKTFLNFDKDWENAAVHFLEENYRSTATIVNAAQAVVQNNRFRTPKKLRTSNPEGDRIALFEAWGENEEAAWIARQILNLKTSKGSIGILYRTNAQSRAIEQALIREDIPYRIFGGLKFYERREVKDAVAALRYAANPKDELSRERLEKNLSRRKFVEFQKSVAATAKPTPAEVLNIFLETFCYFDYLEQNFINANDRQENIAELATFATEFKTLADLLEKVSLVQSTDTPSSETAEARNKNKEENESVIHLSTIHLAKGLEFDAVFLAGTAEGVLPHIRSMDSEDALEEERRLMYVAMTRARKKLFVSFFGMPSRFLSEIPQEYLLLQSQADNDTYEDETSNRDLEENYDS